MAWSISTPPGLDASPLQVTPPQFVRFSQQFASTHLYSWVERGTHYFREGTQYFNPLSPGAFWQKYVFGHFGGLEAGSRPN